MPPASAFVPGMSAVLGTNCLNAANSLYKFPGRSLEKIHDHVCQTGCQPRPATGASTARILSVVSLRTGRTFYQDDSPEAKDALIQYLDAKYTKIMDKCAPKLNDSHLCHESEKSNEFKKVHQFVCWTRSVWPTDGIASPYVRGEMQEGRRLSQQRADVGGALSGSGEELPGTLSRRGVVARPGILCSVL